MTDTVFLYIEWFYDTAEATEEVFNSQAGTDTAYVADISIFADVETAKASAPHLTWQAIGDGFRALDANSLHEIQPRYIIG